MKLFDRPPIRANAAHSIPPPRPRHRKAIAARFLTQPITIREMEKARSREPSTAVGTTSCPAKKPPIPAIGHFSYVNSPQLGQQFPIGLRNNCLNEGYATMSDRLINGR